MAVQKPSGTVPGLKQKAPPRHRPLLPVFLGLVGGIAADGALEPPVAFWLCMSAGVLAVSLWGARRRTSEWGNWAIALLLLVPLGGALHAVRFRRRPPWHLENLLTVQSRRLCVQGEVLREPGRWTHPGRVYSSGTVRVQEEAGWRCLLRVRGLSRDGRKWVCTAGGLTVLGSGRPPAVRVGDTVRFMANIRRNRPSTNPGGPSLRKIYARMGSFGTAWVGPGDSLRVERRRPWYSSPGVASGRLRGVLKRKLVWNDRRATSGLCEALIFGEREGIGSTDRQLLAEAGAVHFLAISGLHVGLFAAVAWVALLWARVPVRPRWVMLIGLIWLYVFFTGLHVSSRRAAWMLTFLAAAPLLGRRREPISALLGAGVLILVFRPQELFTAGFQFTFLAVWALLFLRAELSGILWPWEPLLQRLQAPSERSLLEDLKYHGRHYLLLSVCVWVAVAPLSAYHFHHFSFLTPLINLVIWPLVLLLIVGAFLLVPAALVAEAAAAPLVWWTEELSLAISRLLKLASGLPGFVRYTPGPPVWWLAAFYAVLGTWVLRGKLRRGRGVFLLGVGALAVAYLGSSARVRRPDHMAMTVVDVGQGQCVVLRPPSGSVMLYDAGSRALGRARDVAGVLWQGRVHRIHALAISHRDFDHCGFVPFLARRFSVEKLLTPPLASGELRPRWEQDLRDRPIPHSALREGGRLVGRELECTVLHPNERFLSETTLSDNDRSLVLMCEYRGRRALLTGDIGEAALRRLAADYGDELRADLLLLPHHGGWEAGLEEFVRLVSPRVAIASCSGQVDRRTRRLLGTLNVPLWATGQEGGVTVRFLQGALELTGHYSGRHETVPSPQRSSMPVLPARGGSGPS